MLVFNAMRCLRTHRYRGWTHRHEDSLPLMQFDAIALQHYFVKICNIMLLLFYSKAFYFKLFMLNQLVSEEFSVLQDYCNGLYYVVVLFMILCPAVNSL